jgi:hypothetical protein
MRGRQWLPKSNKNGWIDEIYESIEKILKHPPYLPNLDRLTIAELTLLAWALRDKDKLHDASPTDVQIQGHS